MHLDEIRIRMKRRHRDAVRPLGARRRIGHVDLHPQEVTDGAVAPPLEQVAGGAIDVQDGVLHDDARQRHDLELLGGAPLGEFDDQRSDAVPEPLRVNVAVCLEAPLGVVLERRVAHDCAVLLDQPGVALRVGQLAPVVGHVFLGPVAGAREGRIERLAHDDDGREVVRPGWSNSGHQVTASGASAASTASMSAGTSIVATDGTTASMVFRPSPVM